jgi:hypothetical protein
MDIALFVGFAASGPLDLPVAVESLAEFETVFGHEIVLAREAASGEPVRGLLHASVRAFFSHGGQRCWVVRVAGAAAQVNRFALPDLLVAWRPGAQARWRFRPAQIGARCAGSWSDGLRVATRVQVQSLRVRLAGGYDDGALPLDVIGAPGLALRTGELLRWPIDGGMLVHGRIAELDAPRADGQGTLQRRLRLRGLCALRAVHGDADDSPPARVRQIGLFVPSEIGAQVERRIPAQGGWDDARRLAITCSVPLRLLPEAGSVLRVRFVPGTAPAWMVVDTVVATDVTAADGGVALRLTGRAFAAGVPGWRTRIDDWARPAGERSMQWLRLDLRARLGAEADDTLERLGMGAPVDPRDAGLNLATLPDDASFFATEGAADPAGRVAAAFELTRRDAFGRLARRFPLASLPLAGEVMVLPLGDPAEFGNGLAAAPSKLPPLQRDGLADFSWTLFAEPLLAQDGADTLADHAQALRDLEAERRGSAGKPPPGLRGMHAAFGGVVTAVVDEPTLLALPDAGQSGWQSAADGQSPWTELPAPPAAEAVDEGAFEDCALTPLAAPAFVRGADPDAAGNFTLQWTEPEPGASYTLEEASDRSFGNATTVFAGTLRRFAILGKPAGLQCYRVRARLGARLSPWSRAVEIRIGATGYVTRPWSGDDLLAVHRLMLRTAAGRGDLLAVLGLPRHFDADAAIAHANALRDPDAAAVGDAPRPIGADEERALSHGALYHPWLFTRRVDAVVAAPPEGAVCGQLAASARSRGAWIAVANQPLRDVVEVGAGATREQRQQLLEAQVNLVRSLPHGFVATTAETLSPDADWRPVNVRRLMILLRRLALRRGAAYVFEPNGATLRRTVERGFEAVLDDLFRRGAFAGADARSAYRIEVGDEVNTPQRHDLGQFWVELKVAPALPLTFLSVRLARSGERLVAQEAR